MFRAAISSALPEQCLSQHLPLPPKGRTVVIGAGKASAAMAAVVERFWPEPLSGVVVTAYGHTVKCNDIEILEANHPVPDQAGIEAAKKVMAAVDDLDADDLVICLISGGGSSLLPMPIEGVTLDDKQALTRSLLHSGATISEINCLRRHLSAIKGGRLALAAAPAKVVNLLISDVPGDNPLNIASGPTVADNTTCANALSILDDYQLKVSETIVTGLKTSAFESVKPDDKRLGFIETHLIATPLGALQAAANVVNTGDIVVRILSDRLEGEAKMVAKQMAIKVREILSASAKTRPCILLSGGEATVTVKGDGKGGRNVEFLLALAIELQGEEGVYALAGDTDGVDGIEPIAGATITPDTLSRAVARGLSAQKMLDNNDAHSFFSTLGDSVVTGPTMTNVNDFRAIYIS